MSLPTYFSQLDPNALTVSIGFFGIWAGIHFSLFEAVGDLKEIRNRALLQVATGQPQSNLEFVRFIDVVQQESKVLLLEPKKKSPLISRLLWLFLAVSVATVAYKPLLVWIPFLPEPDVFYYTYIFVLGITSGFLYYEVQYFREFRRLEKKTADVDCEARSLHVMEL
ncbi:MAG: hypothetical protein Q8S20_17380 [Sulfuritalea sp.]|nr:hypothetical protein [Sulfuritalea sp.]